MLGHLAEHVRVQVLRPGVGHHGGDDGAGAHRVAADARAVARTVEAYGKVDVLVNNAGVLEEGLKPIDRVTDEDMDRILGINTKGTMYCMREALAEMNPRRNCPL